MIVKNLKTLLQLLVIVFRLVALVPDQASGSLSSIPASLPLANNWDVGPVGCLENVLCVLLVEEKIFV